MRWPSPPLPPVTTATVPFNSMSVSPISVDEGNGATIARSRAPPKRDQHESTGQPPKDREVFAHGPGRGAPHQWRTMPGGLDGRPASTWPEARGFALRLRFGQCATGVARPD